MVARSVGTRKRLSAGQAQNQVECRWEELACLARHAGPGPRI